MSFRVDGYHSRYNKKEMTGIMNKFYERKPNVKIDIPKFDRGDMKFSVQTFDSKKDVCMEHFVKNRDRYNYIMDDFSKLLKGTRVEGTEIDVAMMDLNHKDNSSDYKLSETSQSFRNRYRTLGFQQQQGFSDKSEGYSEVNRILVRADMMRPRILVHELAHVLDVAKAKDGSVHRSADEYNSVYYNPDIQTDGKSYFDVCVAYQMEANSFLKDRSEVSGYDAMRSDVSGYKNYMFHPSEIHSRLFENFYAKDVDAYRDYDNKIENIYGYDNADYNNVGKSLNIGDRIASRLYDNNPMVRDYMMMEYAEIIPENHPEKAKYMELHNEKELMSNQEVKSLEPEGFADDDLDEIENDSSEYKSASDNSTEGPSDAELLARFEQVEASSIDAPDVNSREHGDYGPSLY